jgi:hypothetical protein
MILNWPIRKNTIRKWIFCFWLVNSINKTKLSTRLSIALSIFFLFFYFFCWCFVKNPILPSMIE